MMGRHRWSAIAAAGILVGCSPEATPPAECDVLLISLDTVRADFLDFRDAELAPHLTRLAKRGVIFESAIAGSSWTLPSHAELFTGLPPRQGGS